MAARLPVHTLAPPLMVSPPLLRLALLALAVSLVLPGCMSQLPRTLFVYAEDAATFRLEYAKEPAAIADSLRRRGCTTYEVVFECPMHDASGRSYTVEVSYVDRYSPTAVPPRDQTVTMADTGNNQTGWYSTSDGLVIESRDTVGNHSLSRPSARGSSPRASAPSLRLQVWARVLAGDGTPVVLAGDGAAAVRASLYDLLVQDLPAVKAYYQ